MKPSIFFAVAALLLSSCTPKKDTVDAGKPQVGLIMKALTSESFATMTKRAVAHHAAHADGYDLLVNGIKYETDLAEQVNLVDQVVANGAQAIVIAPADSKALVPVLKRAADQGVLIINIDNKLDADALAQSGLKVSFVGPDNRAGAKQVGLALAKKLAAGDAVAIIEGVPSVFNGQQRRAGFEDAMKEAGMKIVSVQAGHGELEKANAVASSILSEHPTLKAILCSNDFMALGAVSAIQGAGKTGQVQVVGFDHISAIRPMLEDGRVTATADPHSDQLAVSGIEAALKILREKASPQDQTTAVDVIAR